jgi:hypothetical protein
VVSKFCTFLQVKVKVLLVVILEIVSGAVEFKDFVPVQSPPAVQLVALVEVQDRFVDPPDITDIGEAERFTVGACALTVTFTNLSTVPPSPVQERLKVVSSLSKVLS